MFKGNISMLHFRYACCLLLSHSEAESGAISRAVAVEFRYSLSYVSCCSWFSVHVLKFIST